MNGNCTKGKSQEAINQCKNILKIYFWIHGLGLPLESGSLWKSRLQVVLSLILAIVLEGNALYVLLLAFEKYDTSDTRSVVRLSVLLFYNGISIVQRYFFCSRSGQFDTALTKLEKIHSNLPNRSSFNVKCKIMTILVIKDALSVALAVSFCYNVSFGYNVASSDNGVMQSYVVYSDIRINSFFVLWRNTEQCVALYFAFFCHVLKKAFSRLKEVISNDDLSKQAAVKMYNEILEATRMTNDTFHTVIFATLSFCILGLFHHSYILFFIGHYSESDLMNRISLLVVNYGFVLIICLFASSVKNGALDVKYLLRKMPQKVWFQSRLRENGLQIHDDFPGFTILDSIILDKSFILTASGTFLTYGIMIATLSISFREEKPACLCNKATT